MRREARLMVVVALVLVVVAMAVVYAAEKAKTAPVQEVVRAKRFEVVDEKGKVKISLACEGESGANPRCTIYDSRGQARLMVGISTTSAHDSPYVYLNTERKGAGIGLEVIETRGGAVSRIQVIGPDGQSAVLGAMGLPGGDVGGEGALKPTLAMEGKRPVSSLVLFGSHGKAIWQAP